MKTTVALLLAVATLVVGVSTLDPQVCDDPDCMYLQDGQWYDGRLSIESDFMLLWFNVSSIFPAEVNPGANGLPDISGTITLSDPGNMRQAYVWLPHPHGHGQDASVGMWNPVNPYRGFVLEDWMLRNLSTWLPDVQFPDTVAAGEQPEPPLKGIVDDFLVPVYVRGVVGNWTSEFRVKVTGRVLPPLLLSDGVTSAVKYGPSVLNSSRPYIAAYSNLQFTPNPTTLAAGLRGNAYFQVVNAPNTCKGPAAGLLVARGRPPALEPDDGLLQASFDADGIDLNFEGAYDICVSLDVGAAPGTVTNAKYYTAAAHSSLLWSLNLPTSQDLTASLNVPRKVTVSANNADGTTPVYKRTAQSVFHEKDYFHLSVPKNTFQYPVIVPLSLDHYGHDLIFSTMMHEGPGKSGGMLPNSGYKNVSMWLSDGRSCAGAGGVRSDQDADSIPLVQRTNEGLLINSVDDAHDFLVRVRQYIYQVTDESTCSTQHQYNFTVYPPVSLPAQVPEVKLGDCLAVSIPVHSVQYFKIVFTPEQLAAYKVDPDPANPNPIQPPTTSVVISASGLVFKLDDPTDPGKAPGRLVPEWGGGGVGVSYRVWIGGPAEVPYQGLQPNHIASDSVELIAEELVPNKPYYVAVWTALDFDDFPDITDEVCSRMVDEWETRQSVNSGAPLDKMAPVAVLSIGACHSQGQCGAFEQYGLDPNPSEPYVHFLEPRCNCLAGYVGSDCQFKCPTDQPADAVCFAKPQSGNSLSAQEHKGTTALPPFAPFLRRSVPTSSLVAGWGVSMTPNGAMHGGIERKSFSAYSSSNEDGIFGIEASGSNVSAFFLLWMFCLLVILVVLWMFCLPSDFCSRQRLGCAILCCPMFKKTFMQSMKFAAAAGGPGLFPNGPQRSSSDNWVPLAENSGNELGGTYNPPDNNFAVL